MQINSIKKKLTKELVIGLAALLVIGGFTFFLDDYSQTHAHETDEMQRNVDEVANKARMLREKFTNIQKDADIYSEYLERSKNEGLLVSRLQVANKFDELAEKYFMTLTKKAMPAPQELKEKYARPFAIAMSSDAQVSFEALTDEDVYAFIRSVTEEMPGIVKFKKFTIKRDSKVSDDNVRTIAAQGKFKLVSGEIVFTLYGLKLAESKAAGASANPIDPANPASINPAILQNIQNAPR